MQQDLLAVAQVHATLALAGVTADAACVAPLVQTPRGRKELGYGA